MWLTGAPLQEPKREVYNSVALDQVVAKHTKQFFCRQPSLVMSVDAGVGFLSRTGTISYSYTGKPIPAENNPRQIFNRLQGYKENLPTLVAGGANMGLKHDQYWRNGKTRMSDVFLSILHSLGVEEETFADSTKAGAREVFTKA